MSVEAGWGIGVAKPLEQFEIKTLVDIPVGGLDASFTNASFFMVIAVAAVTLFLTALSDKPEPACEGRKSEAFRPPTDATRPLRRNGSV